MTAQARLKALIAAVRNDIDHCTELETLLTEQQQALLRHDSDRLIALNEQIEARLEPLRAHARNRSEQLRALGLSADAQGMTRLLDKLPAALADQLRPLWRELEQRLQRCRQYNDRNGRVLAGQRELLGSLVSPSEHSDYGSAYP